MRPDQCHGHKESCPAPLRFALVQVEPIDRPSCCDHGESKGCCFAEGQPKYCCADIEQKERDASPSNDLLQRIVRALNLGSTSLRNDGFIYAADGVDEILTELGAIAAAQPFTETT